MKMDLNTEYVKKKLKENGYKFTNQRVLVYNSFIHNKEKHLTTEQVFHDVSKIDSSIGIATVYRTVQLFYEIGLINQINFGDNVTRYEIKLNDKEHTHHHLICLKCGKVQEVKIDLLDDLENEVEKNERFKIVDHQLKFTGYCKDCYEKLQENKINAK